MSRSLQPPADALAGLGGSFRRLYTEHAPMVRAALHQLGVAPASLEDATQDVFVVLYRRAACFDRDRSLKNWLWGIARGVASTYRRSERRHHRLVGALPTERTAAPPEREVARAEATRILDRFLGTLDADKCAVFVLAEVEGRSGPEISKMLEVNVNTVYARLRAARRHFASAVDEHHDRSARPLFATWLPAAWIPRIASVAVGAGAMATALSLPMSSSLSEATVEPTLARVVIPDEPAAELPPPPTPVVPAVSARRVSAPRFVSEPEPEPETVAIEAAPLEAPPRARARRERTMARVDLVTPTSAETIEVAAPPVTMPPQRPWGEHIVARAPASRVVEPLVAPRASFVGKLDDLAGGL